MMLSECAPGDIVVIVWPHGSDVDPRDRELRGTEQYVQLSAIRFQNKKRSTSGQPYGAFVRLVDYETLMPDLTSRGFCVIDNVEVIDVVERHRVRVLSNDSDDRDRDDPLKGTVR